jgi:hypothetical protein
MEFPYIGEKRQNIDPENSIYTTRYLTKDKIESREEIRNQLMS